MQKKIIAISTALALTLAAAPALAFNWNNSDDITVNNYKSAKVSNDVTVTSSTGGNISAGGTGGNGGNGGVKGKMNMGNDGNDGGNGGAGGEGGDITTGNAYAKAKVVNKVNTDVTNVSCDCQDTDDITVNNKDKAKVRNTVAVGAHTGDNQSYGYDGGSGGNGGVGGKVNVGNDDNDGGNGGAGGDGGEVNTGDSHSKAKVVNKVNTIITRIK